MPCLRRPAENVGRADWRYRWRLEAPTPSRVPPMGGVNDLEGILSRIAEPVKHYFRLSPIRTSDLFYPRHELTVGEISFGSIAKCAAWDAVVQHIAGTAVPAVDSVICERTVRCPLNCLRQYPAVVTRLHRDCVNPKHHRSITEHILHDSYGRHGFSDRRLLSCILVI